MNGMNAIYSDDGDKTGLDHGHSSSSSSRSHYWANLAEAADAVDNAGVAAHKSTAYAAVTSSTATVSATLKVETGKALDFEQDTSQVSPAKDISQECSKYTHNIQKYALLVLMYSVLSSFYYYFYLIYQFIYFHCYRHP
jgi:hypothetical protein